MAGSIILASSSPRRRELLEKMGISYTLRVCPTDENVQAPPKQAVGILAQRKAQAAAQGLKEGLVLGADTLVALDDMALGKPRDRQQAIEMLQALSGRVHQVYTGVCLADAASGECRVEVDETLVRFRQLSLKEIEDYVDTKEPMDKAGAYAIQGGAARFIEDIDGSFENVMGLPIQLLHRMLQETEG